MPSTSPASPSPPARRALLVDRHALDRDLLAHALGHTLGFVVARTTPSLVDRPSPPAPDAPVDVAVIRASAPGLDLRGEVAAAGDLPGAPRVVVLAGYVDAYLVERLHAAGAHAVASSDTPLAEVITLLQGATAAPANRVDRSPLGHRHRLTARELEILDHLADGLAPGQIAHLLEVRVSTIRDHVKSLRSKLDCTSATQLVVTAHRLGLVPHVGRPLR